MTNIIDSKEMISVYEADNIYKGCNYILTSPERKDGVIYGSVYAISDTRETHRELVKLEKDLRKNGIDTLIGGEYRDSIGISDMRYERIA